MSKKLYTRTLIVRIKMIHEQLQAGKFPNCQSLAREIQVSAKTIQRDISCMRDSMRMPIEYDEIRHGYYYTREVPGDMPLVVANHDELLGLFLARIQLEKMGGTRISDALSKLLQRVVGESTASITFSWNDLNSLLEVKSAGVSEPEFELLDLITRGLMEKRVFTFRYRKHGADLWEKRSVHPLHMVFTEGTWYLLAHDEARDELRTFSLQRMQEPQLLKKKFRPHPEFDPATHLQGSFGIFLPEPGQRQVRHVHLRFSGFLGRIIAERHWHSTQEIEEVTVDDEKYVDLHLDLSDLTEISRWILGWGGKVEVIAPQELRDIIRKEAHCIAELYGPDPHSQRELFRD